MNPEDFWYVKLRDWGDRGNRKMPAEKIGSYSDDFEENDSIYTYDETQETDHGNWGICGYRSADQLVVLDLDAHKIEDFDPEKVARPETGVPIVKSIKEGRDVPGFHFYTLVDNPELDFSSSFSHLDVKANQKGFVASPYHRDDYKIVHDDEFDAFIEDGVVEAFEYDEQQLISCKQKYKGADPDIDIPDEPPEDLPRCLKKCLDARVTIPRDGTFDGNPWIVDSIIGRRLVAFGYSKGEALSLLEEYEPRDGYDEKESSYQLDRLYEKQLHPDSVESIAEHGIDVSDCGCEFCDGSSTIVADDPKHFSEFEIENKDDLIVQSIARTGKSHTLIEEAVKLRDEEKIVYVSGSHSEGRAQVKKFRKHGIQTSHLVGKQRAKQEFDVNVDGPFDPSYVAMDPEEASMRDNINAYHGLIEGAKQADVVVTVPELLHHLDDFDWLIMTEEAAFDRMLSSEIKIMDVERFNGYDRIVNGTLHDHATTAQSIIDYIDDLGTTHDKHNWIRTTAQVIIDICEILEEWNPGGWDDVEAGWDALVEDIEQRLDDIAFETPPNLTEVRTWLMNRFNRATAPILNFMFADGVFTYENGNRKQLFLIGDTDRCFIELPKDLTIWTAGNSVPAMEEFHEIVNGSSPEVKPFLGGFTPVQDSVCVLKYTGGRNPNEQSSHVQQIVEEVQLLEEDVGNLLISGQSEHAAQHARRIQKCTLPSHHDDLDALRDYADSGLTVAVAENMWCVEGIDTPFFEMGALYRGGFATPREDYITEQTGDDSLSKAESIRAAQNAVLRPSNVPGEGTGTTPVVVPDMHVPDEIFEMFEVYGVTVIEMDETSQVRKMVIKLIDLDATVHQDTIVDPKKAPDTPRPFDQLFNATTG